MKIRIALFLVLLVTVSVSPLWAPEKITKLNVGNTPLSQGEIKIGETLTTADGYTIDPGVYRIAVALDSTGNAQFIFAPSKPGQPTSLPGLQKNAMNTTKVTTEQQLTVSGRIERNTLVKGLASNLDGSFKIISLAPSEVQLSFTSKQFEASSILGRSPNNKAADLIPSFVGLEQSTSCGADCVEGFVKVSIRNDGNAMAKGKYNVSIVSPRMYVGTISDIGPGDEKTMTSPAKIKLACCNPASVDAEVHADFYNKDGADSNESNNVQKFTINLKQ